MKKNLVLILLIALPLPSFPGGKPPWMAALIRKSWKDPQFKPYLPPICGRKTVYHQKYHEDMVWANHFCDSMAKKHICFQYTGRDRHDCLGFLRNGLTYFIGHIHTKNFPLFPYLYTEHGNLLMDMEEYPQAAGEYLKAIRKNKKYLPAYLRLTDAFIKMKNYTDAEKVIRRAARLKPESRAVKRRIQTLKKLSKAGHS